MHRRAFARTTLAAGLAGLAGFPGLLMNGSELPARRFRLCLAPGPIGVPDDPRKAIAWARQFGFEALEPSPAFLAGLSATELQSYRAALQDTGLAWGAANLPTAFRGDPAAFQQSLQSLPAWSATLQAAGVTRVATWLSPGHKSLTYVANFRLHAQRLREIARILHDHGLRLGLEYVGPKTSWSASRFPFIHTLAEMKDLLAEIASDNVGLLLDSWHWYTAQETADDLLTLRATDIVLCHLNDAPAGIPVDQQLDNRRELPAATGVIDIKAFLGALLRLGYDGPVVCEPFSASLRQMPPEQALAAVAGALRKAVALATS